MKKSLRNARLRLLFAAALPALSAASAGAQRVDFFRSDYMPPNSSAFSIARGWDNNFFFTGAVQTGSGSATNSDLLLVKIKPNGDTLWKRTYGVPERNETGYCVLTPLSDQVVVAGIADDTGSNAGGSAFLASFNAAGTLLWQKSYPLPGKRTAIADMKRLNDGFILCGTVTDSVTENTDAWLLKTDLNGEKLWSNNYGGPGYDDAWQVERTPDGGFMLAGGSYSYRTGTRHDDAWLVKTTSSGSQVWIKHYGNADTVDWIWSMAPVGNPAAPTGYIFTGVKNRNPNVMASEMFLARVDTGGNIVWDIPMTGRAGYREGLSVEPTLHNTFYVTGTELEPTGSLSLLAMDIDSNGNVLNELHYNNPFPEWIRPRAVYINNLSDAYVAGQQITPGDRIGAFVAHIRDINHSAISVAGVAEPTAISVYPNPAATYCSISSEGEAMRRIVLRDATGRVALDLTNPDAHLERISLNGMPKGLYLITVYTGGIAPINLRLTIR